MKGGWSPAEPVVRVALDSAVTGLLGEPAAEVELPHAVLVERPDVQVASAMVREALGVRDERSTHPIASCGGGDREVHDLQEPRVLVDTDRPQGRGAVEREPVPTVADCGGRLVGREPGLVRDAWQVQEVDERLDGREVPDAGTANLHCD